MDPSDLIRRFWAESEHVRTTELILVCLVGVAVLAIVARESEFRIHSADDWWGDPGTDSRLPEIHLEPELVFSLFSSAADLSRSRLYVVERFPSKRSAHFAHGNRFGPDNDGSDGRRFSLSYGLPLAVAFVFGALISPPDAVAALSITQNLRVPRKIIVILEGESLVNDGHFFHLVPFRCGRRDDRSFSLGQATCNFFLWPPAASVSVSQWAWLQRQVQKTLGRSASANNVIAAHSVHCLLQR